MRGEEGFLYIVRILTLSLRKEEEEVRELVFARKGERARVARFPRKTFFQPSFVQKGEEEGRIGLSPSGEKGKEALLFLGRSHLPKGDLLSRGAREKFKKRPPVPEKRKRDGGAWPLPKEKL